MLKGGGAAVVLCNGVVSRNGVGASLCERECCLHAHLEAKFRESRRVKNSVENRCYPTSAHLLSQHLVGRDVQSSEFKARLAYSASSGQPRVHRETLFQTTNNNKDTKERTSLPNLGVYA